MFQLKNVFCYFFDKVLSFVYQLFDNNGIIKSLINIKQEFSFNNIFNFKLQQLINVVPLVWKKIIKETDNTNNLLLQNHHLI